MKLKLLGRLLPVAAVLTLLSQPVYAATNFVGGFLTGSNAWHATNTYIMTNFTYVLSNAVLNIEPGTVIKGRDGVFTNENGIPGGYGTLVVNRGGRIFADGTADKPIIFTAEIDDVNDPFDIPTSGLGSRGLWGGIVINGRAVLNSSVRLNLTPVQDTYEGIPDASGPGGERLFRYGGDDDNDSSGVLRYVSIRHGGKRIEANREINGLSLGAVGRGTTIEFVECYLIADDGFEFFGGSVNTKYLVSAFCDDDSFDADQGFSGKNQFWFSIQAQDARDEGGELNGVPNELDATGTFPFGASFQIYNWTAIGAGTGTNTGNEALVIRQVANPKIYNSVFAQFDGRRLVLGTNSAPEIAYNIFHRVTQGNGNLGSTPGTPLALNPDQDPLFRGIARNNTSQLDPRPLPSSPVFGGFTNAPSDGFYTAASYKGAFSSCDNWMRGWTALDHNLFLGTLFNNPTNNLVHVGGFLTGSNIWHATNTYIMTNFTYVLSNAVLALEPGTVVKGRDGVFTNENGIPGGYGTLVVNRGGRIFAEGTACDPIVFTAETDDINDPLDLPTSGLGSRGLWGGIVINGRAVLNSSVRLNVTPVQDTYEGIPDATGPGGERLFRYGGDDDNDSSGVLRYVSIRHGGKRIEANREINGLSLGAVGRGTTIEFVECYLIADDGFEFFGGSVNTKYLVSAFCDDDSFDADQGFSGKNQFWFSIQAQDARDEGGELNGVPNELDATGTFPFGATFQIYNWTALGAGTGTNTGNEALVIRQVANPKIYNSVFAQFDGRKLVLGTNSAPEIAYNIFHRVTQGNGNLGSTPGTPLALNTDEDPIFRGVSRENLGQLDPTPLATSPVYTGYTNAPNDGFFVTTATNKGAFSAENWMLRWSALDNNAFLSWRSLSEAPGTRIAPPQCPAPSLSITHSAGNVEISFSSQSSCNYQLQSTDSLLGSWADDGSSVAGTGSNISLSRAVSGSGNQFFRVVTQ